MAAEILVTLVVEVVGQMVVQLGAQAAEAKGRTWLDRSAFDELGDEAKQAFIAGLLFVASADGALSKSELEEIESRLQGLDIDQKGPHFDLALAARSEVADAADGDKEAFAARVVARLPEGRGREALLRVSIAVALKGDLGSQLAAVRLLGKSMGRAEADLEKLIVEEQQRVIR